MKKTFLFLLLAFLLTGCESMYYDMVMDKPDPKAGKDDALEKANSVDRLGSYR